MIIRKKEPCTWFDYNKTFSWLCFLKVGCKQESLFHLCGRSKFGIWLWLWLYDCGRLDRRTGSAFPVPPTSHRKSLHTSNNLPHTPAHSFLPMRRSLFSVGGFNLIIRSDYCQKKIEYKVPCICVKYVYSYRHHER